MKRIIKIGMDVHTTNYTLCIFEPSFEHEGTVHCITQIKPEVKNIVDVIDKLKEKLKVDELDIVCGYEAGCLGYSLYHELKDKGISCIILAPSTMRVQKGGKKLKNDYRDARQIAECLSYGGYSAVYVPTKLDNAVKVTPASGKVMLRARGSNITITDEGPGLQVGKTSWGHGLGLVITRELLDKLGATMQMQNRPGAGLEISIDL